MRRRTAGRSPAIATPGRISSIPPPKERLRCNLNGNGGTCEKQQFSSAYFVEEGSYDNGAEETGDGQRKHVEADLVLFEVECFLEDVGVLVVNEVEEEGLCEDETETHYEFFGVFCYALAEQI